MDEERKLAGELDNRHLAVAPGALDLAAGERRQRRIDGLERNHSRRERRFDLGAREDGAKAANGDLDFGQFRHQ